MGYSELLSEDANDVDSIKLYSKTIHGEAIRLSTIIDNLFNTVLIDKEEFAITIEKINLKDFIQNIIKEDVQKVKINNVSVVAEIADDIGEILNSKESLSLVLVNLLSNMVKFSYDKTQAKVEANKENGNVIIKFTNYGDGISQEYAANLFEKFSRAETTVHTLSGAGLGLFIARKIARIHGGDITFESTPKEKTIFYLTLPIKSKFDVNNFSSSTINI
jgi:signal transduction histidine kinase